MLSSEAPTPLWVGVTPGSVAAGEHNQQGPHTWAFGNCSKAERPRGRRGLGATDMLLSKVGVVSLERKSGESCMYIGDVA